MAFWDNWFKVDCSRCRQPFKKEELMAFEDMKICAPCHEAIEEERAQREKERLERLAAEEAARQALLDRPFK